MKTNSTPKLSFRELVMRLRGNAIIHKSEPWAETLEAAADALESVGAIRLELMREQYALKMACQYMADHHICARLPYKVCEKKVAGDAGCVDCMINYFHELADEDAGSKIPDNQKES